MSRGTSIAVLLGLAVAVPTGVRAAEIVWAGAGASNWNGGGNWVLGNVPGSSDTVSLKGWEPLVRTSWTITAWNTNSGNPTTNAKDGHLATSWWSGAAMSTSAWVQIDLGSTQTFGGLDLKEILNGTDYPRGYDIYVSSDGSTWGSPIFSNNAGSADDQNQFGDQTARYIKIQINTNSATNWWAISEITVWGTAGDTQLAMGGMTAASSTSYSSGGQGPAANAIDFNRATLFQTGADQASNMWFNLNMGTTQTISAITMDSYLSPGDYANGYKVEVSTTASCNGGTIGSYTQVTTGSGTTEFLQITFTPQSALCVRVTLTANSGSNWWTISEFHVFGVPATCTMTAATTMAGLNIKNATTFAQGSGNTLTINGNINQSAGTFTGSNSSITLSSLNLSGGTFTSTSDLLNIDAFNKTGGTFTHNSGRLMLSASGNQTFATNGTTFNHVFINDGLVGYWKLDDGTTPIVDSSGYAQSGALTAGPSWVGAGAGAPLNFTNSNAMTLNGTSQYGRITRTTTLEPASVTVSAWVKPTATQISYAKILSKTYNNGASTPYGSYELQLNPGGAGATVVGVEAGTAVNSYGVASAVNAVPAGSWTHVAGVYDPNGGSPQIRLYVNGVSVGSTSVSGAILYDTSSAGDFYIGNNGSVQYMAGSIDDVRIYNRVLTDQEIYSLFIGNQPGTTQATQTMTGAPVVAGDLVLASGKLDIGSNALSVGGNWYNYGGLFASTGTVTLNTTSSKVIRSAGQPFNNLTLSGSGATWALEDWLKVTSTLTMTNGTLSPGSNAIHAGNISKTSGALTAGTGTVVLDSTGNQSESSGFSFNNLRIEAPNESGLIAYYKFDEGQGKIARDASGHGNDGTLTSASWTDSLPGPIGFDNHAAVKLSNSGYGVLGSSSLPVNSAAQTIAFWVNNAASQTGALDHYMVALSNLSNSGISVGLLNSNGNLAAWKWGATALVSTAAPSTGAWHHVVYTCDGANNSTLYLDGASVSTGNTMTNSSAPTNIQIGGFNSSGSYTGSIDDLRIYNVALTATEVKNLYAGGYAGAGSSATVALGANLTVNHTLAIDDGILDTGAYTINAAATDSTQTATVNGTLTVGSNTVTLNGGLTVGKLGSVTENTAGGKIVLGTGKALEYDEPSGGAVGFPTAAFNWNTFAFWREYVTFSSYVGATTADTVLATTADGGTKYSWQLPSGKGSLVGTPRWNTEGTSPGTQYIYLITTLGYVYKLLDDGTQFTTVSGWPYHNGASATATSPLGNDSTNLYWSGNDGSGNPYIFSLTLAGNPPTLHGPFSVSSTVSAAPALATVGVTPYVFFAIANKVYLETLSLGSGCNSIQPTTAVNGRVTVYNNIVYFPEDNGKVWALNGTTCPTLPTTSWSYQDTDATRHPGGCSAGNQCSVKNIYVDVTANRTCFGDKDGHIYVLNSSGTVLNAGYPWQIASGDVISVAPVSRNGVLLIGATNGTNYKVYEIDETDGTTRQLTRTWTFSAAVSSISYNPSAAGGAGAYTVGTSDGKLYYINAANDPTSSHT